MSVMFYFRLRYLKENYSGERLFMQMEVKHTLCTRCSLTQFVIHTQTLPTVKMLSETTFCMRKMSMCMKGFDNMKSFDISGTQKLHVNYICIVFLSVQILKLSEGNGYLWFWVLQIQMSLLDLICCYSFFSHHYQRQTLHGRKCDRSMDEIEIAKQFPWCSLSPANHPAFTISL